MKCNQTPDAEIERLLKKGALHVNGGVFAVGMLALASVFAADLAPEGLEEGFEVGSVLALLGLPWLWWSIALPRWRTWAFRQIPTRHWRRLHRRAVDNMLLWPPGHWAQRTEILRVQDRQMRRQIHRQLAR